MSILTTALAPVAHFTKSTMTQSLLKTSFVATTLFSALSQAQSLEIELTNATSGIEFAAVSVAIHDDSTGYFTVGESFSDSLEAMAERG
ncbi:hypothetical protein L0B53_02835 [Vibrio sp. SS-MA-C1-2]|uniref:hypothetical protein n=1 Tax=Vibrio sp. SS-MA-C1-2 TaxID=2908646 RepID=UPI001F2DE417|nr:hypothetical protein [Vibrio sp. SS-MA-C1-2]UJF16895.1 hypothetical protein L0B53_02835 [Vibrio sp. SS-MA-C1-2]